MGDSSENNNATEKDRGMSESVSLSRVENEDDSEEGWRGRTFITETLLNTLDAVGGLDGRAAVAGVDEQTQATMLLRKRKDARTVDEALVATKEDHTHRMTALDKREAKLAAKIKAMQETIAKFRPFTEENDAKVDKASRKERSEATAADKLQQDIAGVNAEIA